MKNNNNLTTLLRKYINNDCSTQEVGHLLDYFKTGDNEALLKELILKELESDDFSTNEADESINEVFKNLKKEIANEKQPLVLPFYKKTWLRIAAAAIIVIGAGFILFQQIGKKASLADNKPGNQPIIIKSAKDNALLTLADGTTLMLDSVKNGIISENDGIKILKSDGLITYNNSSNQTPATTINHTITTSRGNKYQLQLADGTKIWLNAGSSVTYPVAFSGDERKVSLTGEAFFDVAHDKTKPFIAQISSSTGKKSGEIKVLGTRFNVNNYDDEKIIKTVLLDGSIKFIENNNNSHLIKPGEQIILEKATSKIKISKVNTDKAIAWKNELFRFEEDNIETIMQQLSRWYNVDVTYSGEIGNETFSGIISRSSDIGDVLKILETGGFKFKQQGRNITVTK